MNDHAPSQSFKSLTHTLAVTGSVAILVGTLTILGVFTRSRIHTSNAARPGTPKPKPPLLRSRSTSSTRRCG